MSTSPSISIIVPIYNVDQYLEECLDSIVAQTCSDWECILVDDGSPDGSPAICDRYADADPRFRVIHSQNRGVAAARNTGIEASRGEYIAWIDPDDVAEPQLLETLLHLIISTGADASQVGFTRDFVGFRRAKSLVNATITVDNATALRELVADKRVPSYLWNKMFRRHVVRPNFPEGKTFEDIFALTEWFSRIKSMTLAPDILYHYRMRRGSIINSHYAANRLDYIDVCHHRADLMARLDPTTFTNRRRNAFLLNAAIGGAKTIARLERNVDVRNDAIAEISRNIAKIADPGIGTMGLKRWLRMKNLKHTPRFFTWLMRTVWLLDFQSRHRIHHLYE